MVLRIPTLSDTTVEVLKFGNRSRQTITHITKQSIPVSPSTCQNSEVSYYLYACTLLTLVDSGRWIF